MENASKALIMAGSILISIIVISLLVFGYGQLSNTEAANSEIARTDEFAEYMARFEQFNRTLYGSELLSLANLEEDYNASQTREDLGYDRINITVNIKKTIVGSEYFTTGEHSIDDISNDKQKIEDEIDKYSISQRKYNNRSVKYYSQKRAREIAIDFNMNPPSDMMDYDIEEIYLRRNSITSKFT